MVELLLIGGAVVGLGFILMLVAGVIKSLRSRRSKDIFEPTDIQEIVKPEIRKLVDYWGSGTSIKLRYRYDSKGTVQRQLDFTADINDESMDKVDVKVDEEQLEEDYDEGRISKRVYNMIKKFGQEPVHILIVRPSGLVSKFMWIISQVLLGGDDTIERIIIIPDRLIRDDVDYMTIKNEAEFRRFAGMDVAVEASAFNFVQSVGFKNLYEQSLQDQANYHKQVNFYASRFAQELQRIEKEGEVEKGKWAGKDVGIVNEES